MWVVWERTRGREWGGGGGVTGAIGIRAIRAGLAGAAVGLEETRVAGWAAGLHARGRQLHCPLQILTADFRLGPFVHELCLQKQSTTQPSCVGLSSGIYLESGEILGSSESSTKVGHFVLVTDISQARRLVPGTWSCSINIC